VRVAALAAALALAACGDKKPAPTRPAPVDQGMLSAEWVYQPATQETRDATGPLTVDPSIGSQGPRRLLHTARGDALDAVLVGEANLTVNLEARSLADAMDLRAGARATLYRVDAGNLCLGAQATHVVWYEPELIEGRTLALALVAGGAPGDPGSTICRVLRYTRSRSGGDEGVR
jgi:hypothetical protein